MAKVIKPKVAKANQDDLYKAQEAERKKKEAIKKYSGKKSN